MVASRQRLVTSARLNGKLASEPMADLVRPRAIIRGCRDTPTPAQVDGAVTSGPDLSVEVDGLRLPNPFVIGSGALSFAKCGCPRTVTHPGPPGTNYAVMKKAFEEGWGGVIAKTVSLDSSKVHTT